MGEAIPVSMGQTYISDDGLEVNYIDLVRAIIAQTAVDYVDALNALEKNPNDFNAYYTVDEAELFLYSDKMGDLITRELRKRAEEGSTYRRNGATLTASTQKRSRRGFKIKYLYVVHSPEGNLICKGTLDEVSAQLHVPKTTIWQRSRKGTKCTKQNPYIVTREEIKERQG